MSAKGCLITAEMEALAYGGAFVGRITRGPAEIIGKKAFVRLVLPGEKVEARVICDKKNYLQAEALSLLEPAPRRIAPKCPVFGVCGGCDLQHMPLSMQRQAKLEMVQGALEKQAGLKPVLGIKVLAEDLPGFKYRRRLSLHVDGSGRLGFYRAGSREVVEMERCFLAVDELNGALLRLRPPLKSCACYIGTVVLEEHAGEVFACLKTREAAGETGFEFPPELLSSLSAVESNLMVLRGKTQVFAQRRSASIDKSNQVPPVVGHFSQVNQEANQVLQRAVLAHADSPEVTDLYAGSGNLSLPLASAGKKVQAVEVNGVLAAHGRRLADLEGVSDRLIFYNMSCEEFLNRHAPCPVVILDPPRSGAKEVVKKLSAARCRRIIYVSCNLPTLVRDLKTLCSQGYVLEQVMLLDMFAQTHHVETISVLGAEE